MWRVMRLATVLGSLSGTVGPTLMHGRVTTKETFSRADWSVDPRGGSTVGTKDWPIAAEQGLITISSDEIAILSMLFQAIISSII
jgi:hypothetical protein